MKEREIRDSTVHKRYLELVRADAEKIFNDSSTFQHFPCPACASPRSDVQFKKDNFQYVQCTSCLTLYNDPRPQYGDIQKLYRDSESTKFWVEKFFSPFAEARREKIFRPRAEYIASKFPHYRSAVIGDIGAGFGLFLEELRALWREAGFWAIEPSEDMAGICSSKGFNVIKSMVEDIEERDGTFDLLTSFELVEHLYEPILFLEKINALLKKGGIFYFTTLNGLGFDIQVLWERSKSISPPHHLNFFNPSSISLLLNRSGFEVIEVATPGKLDWDIVDTAALEEKVDVGRFFATVRSFGSETAKTRFQEWISEFNFSSHMRVIARKI
jgi:2-polyprenyl-3-methyl-5-hydroxy-6-metoxy-1,4-benzoquinol methylase